jgi:serine/threonine protein kinase
MMTKLNPYSAPEILAMDEVVAESDFYSIGLILYEIMKQSPAIPR